MNLKYLFHSGKNSNLKFYVTGYARHLIPKWLYTSLLGSKLRTINRHPDKEYMRKRADYYCKKNGAEKELVTAGFNDTLSDFNHRHQNAYYIDLYRTSRWFPASMKCSIVPGDVTQVPGLPSIVKSRPIHGNNINSVILKLDSARHFIFINDKIPFSKKKDIVVFRGNATQEHRSKFLQMYFGHPLVDAGIPESHHRHYQPAEWKTRKLTIYDHLQYKFIMSLEGNDVASNLKWVMSSNSIAVMPRPVYETWFMEGTLIPDYHYIEIKPDYSDLEEKINYYIEHVDEAMEIIRHAHEYVDQFRNRKREKLIEIMTLNKYFYG